MRTACVARARIGISLLLAAAAAGALAADDLAPEVLLLARFKQKVRQDIGRLANCTCIETIERSVRAPGTNAYQFLDRVRLEVTNAGAKELMTWPGGERFEEWAVTSFVKSGLVASGMFASSAGNLFLRDGATFQYGGTEDLEGRRTVRFDFRVPSLSSSYRLRSGADVTTVATKGSFWFDADSMELARLDQFADEIPAGFELTGALTRIQFARLTNSDPQILAPAAAEIELRHSSGELRRNTIRFTQCREYRAESSISFGVPGTAAAASQAAPARVEVPAGLKIGMEMESGFDSASAAIGDAVRARVVKAVVRDGKTIVPKGAVAAGRIRMMDRQGRAGGFLIGFELTGLQWENSRADFHGSLVEVGNGPPVEGKRAAQTANVMPITGAAPPIEAGTPERNGTLRVAASGITGVGMVFAKGERWRLEPGFRMVWRTSLP